MGQPSEAAQALKAAIAALYGGAGPQQQQANQWLNSFAQQPDAWNACLELLSPQQNAEVSFFCANMLLTKVRSEWHKLSSDQQTQISSVISTTFQQFLQQSQARLAMQRLGLLLAAVASLSGAQACQTFAGQCLTMVSSGVGKQVHVGECALSMLAALAEEMFNMDQRQRGALVAATDSSWHQLVQLMQGMVPQHMQAGNVGLVHGALNCLQSWLKLSGDPSASCRASPGQIFSTYPGLFSLLFSLLSLPHWEEEPMTAERLAELATEMLVDVLGPGTLGTDSAVEKQGLEAAIAALLNLQGLVLRPDAAGAAAAKYVCSVASAIAERDADLVAGAGCWQALPLAQLVLQSVSRPEREVCQAATEYFLMLNTVPLAERHQQLGGPIFTSLAPLLFRHACYPAGFNSWAECIEDDEEAFNRFRDQSLTELLESVYGMMGYSFLAALREGLSTATSWEPAEGALYCLWAVRQAARDRASKATPDMQAVAQQTNEVLRSIFMDLCTPGTPLSAFLSSPPTCATAAELVGGYAPWFDACPDSPLEGALQLLLHALRFPVACGSAARGFRAFCMRCSGRLANTQILLGLADLAARVVAPAPDASQVAGVSSSSSSGLGVGVLHMGYEDRAAVNEGLARVASSLPAPQEMVECASKLLQPHLLRCQWYLAEITRQQHHGVPGPRGAAAAGGGGGTAGMANGGAAKMQQQQQSLQQQQQHWGVGREEAKLSKELAWELRLLAVIIRGMDAPGAGGPGAGVHPALKLLEAVWPVIQAVGEVPVCRQQQVVVEAVCEVYTRSLQQARSSAKGLLPHLLPNLVQLQRSSLSPACLDTLATVMETFGEVQGQAELAEAQQQALTSVVSVTTEALHARSAAGQPLSASGDLLRALLGVVDAYLVFARGLLLRNPPVLTAALDWTLAAAGLREKEPASAAFAFLAHLLTVTGKRPGAGAGGGSPAQAAAAAAAARGGLPMGSAVAAMLGRTAAAANGSLGQGNEGGEEDAAGVNALQGLVGGKLEVLVRVLVLGLCDTAPRQLLRPLAGVLYGLLSNEVWRGAAAGHLLSCLQSRELPGMSVGLLKTSDCETFARLLLREPMLTRGRFDALVCDFAAIPRGEGTSDALLGYEL